MTSPDTGKLKLDLEQRETLRDAGLVDSIKGYLEDPLPPAKSPNALEFLVDDKTVELNRMEGQYIAVSFSSKGAQRAKGMFTGFKEGDVPAHTGVDLSLYVSFGPQLEIATATLDDFSKNFHYFYSIVSDPTHTIDCTGGCYIMRDYPQRVKDGNATYWKKGTDRGSNQEMDPDKMMIKFDEWKDGVLTGRCLDPADASRHTGGNSSGTCDVSIWFRIRLVEPAWYQRQLKHKEDCKRPGFNRIRDLLRECASKGRTSNRSTEKIADDLRTAIAAYPSEVSYQNAEGMMPLHQACCSGRPLAIVQILYHAYPEAIRVHDGECFLPLHHAINYNKVLTSWDVVRFLIQKYPDGRMEPERNGRLPIWYLCQIERVGDIPLEETHECFAEMLDGCEDTVHTKGIYGGSALDCCRNEDFKKILTHMVDQKKQT